MEHVTEGRHHKAVGCIIAEPTTTPCPVTLNGIDKQRDDCTIYKVHRELRTLSHSARDNRGRGGAENGLEDEETLNGQIAFIETQVAPVGHTDETGTFAAEHKAEAEEEEQERAEHKVDKVLHQDVHRVLTACKTSFTQRKAWLHPENQHGCQ